MDNTDIMPRPEDQGAAPASTRTVLLSAEVLDDLVGEEPPEPSKRSKIIACVVAFAVALICAFPVAEWAASPTTHADSIEKLDAKAETVTALVGSATAASVAITVLPDDVGTPIANKLVDVAADFAIVLGAIYLEKYLLTILGLAAFRVIVPLACAIFVFAVLAARGPHMRSRLFSVTVRLCLLALAAYILVPASVGISTLIEDTYSYDASGVAQSLSTEAEKSQENTSSSTNNNSSSTSAESSSSSDGNWFTDFIDWAGGLGQTVADAATSAASGITSGVTNVLESAKKWVSSLVEAFAVMIVTCCVIPILVLLFFIWLINLLLGLNIQVPTNPMGGVKARLHRSGGVKKVAKA